MTPAAPLPSTANPIAQMVATRRAALQGEQAQLASDGAWGLALSGGGIRSATFCFGLLKALAHNKVLHRFDLLSTVSGGGYIGATLGKLCQETGAAEVEKALATADKRWFALWLRANGRYLIPHGLQDALFAGANFGRNLIGIHFEIALLGLLLGGLLVGFDLVAWFVAERASDPSSPTAQWLSVGVVGLLSSWPAQWLLLPPVFFAGAVFASAYWCLPEGNKLRLPGFRWVTAVCCLLIAAGLSWHVWAGHGDTNQTLGLSTVLPPIIAGALLAQFVGTLVAQGLCLTPNASLELARNRLTAALAFMLKVGLAIAALGLVDLCAWQLAVALGNPTAAAGWIIVTVTVLRALLPLIGDLPRGLSPLARIGIAELMNLAGLAALATLLIFWVSLVHRSVTVGLFDPKLGLLWTQTTLWFAVVLFLPLLFVVASRGNRAFLNRSSLFSFYRARLTRSYLGAANAARFPVGAAGAIGEFPLTAAVDGPITSVREVNTGDDLGMQGYTPHVRGGPVHLMNVCINQTEDVQRGLFNTDRKGLSMTIGPQAHVCVGQERWHSLDERAALTLGAWTAISGAAVAPGLGATTRPGLAALLTLAGIRLGYWWDSAGLVGRGNTLPTVGKYGQLLAELRGKFAGTERQDWFLTDGGHFENTAAYALLREECELIVVADCGADPRYTFGDLENLVRKARIDLQAEVTFLRPAPRGLADPGNPPLVFGSLNDLASADSHACLCLARVDYRRSNTTGYMVVVKPNMCAGAPVDLVNFKADNRLFPQESTTDQFFSEAQWESYYQLGNLLGGHLRPAFLNDLASQASIWFQQDDGSISAPIQNKTRSKAEPRRIPSRIAATGAVTASLSLGALVTMASSAWQVVDTQLQTMRNGRRVDPTLLKELAEDYGKLSATSLVLTGPRIAPGAASVTVGAPAADEALGKIATSLVRINEEICNDSNKLAFQQNSLITEIASTTVRMCDAQSVQHPSCTRLLGPHPLAGCVLPSAGFRCEPHYWVRAYIGDDPLPKNCPSSPAQEWGWDGLLDLALPGASTFITDIKFLAERVTGVGFNSMSASRSPSSTSLPSGQAGTNDPVVAASGAAAVEAPASAASASTSGSPASSAASSSGSVASSQDTTSKPVCEGQTIYVQIFGPDMRDTARAYRDPWRKLGANVPPIEDVWDTARRANRTAPRAPATVSVLYSDVSSLACAKSLAPSGATWPPKPLPQSLTHTPGVIEVWLPPASSASTQSASTFPATGECYQEDSGTAAVPRYGVYCFSNRAQCNIVRGPNLKRLQTTCKTINLRGQEDLLRLRGFGSSWYAQQANLFGAPFPAFAE